MLREEFFRRELVQELRRVENLIRQESSIEKKIYYFSAAHGITNRTLRYSFSRDVLLADFVLQQIYNVLTDRSNRVKSGDQRIPFEDIHFEKICDGLKLLADRFETGGNVQEPIEIIITSGFSITGPGYYLRVKGDLKL